MAINIAVKPRRRAATVRVNILEARFITMKVIRSRDARPEFFLT